MSKPHQHSDSANFSYGDTGGLRTPKPIVVFQRDERGFVCGTVSFRKREESDPNFAAAMRSWLHVYPLASEDIVWPSRDWPTDVDGRGLSVLEVQALQRTRRAA